MSITKRKNDHIRVCLDENVVSDVRNGFDQYRLIHNALPETDFNSLNIGGNFLSKSISAPIMISSMTGGVEDGELINEHLLEAAETLNIPFAIGSQRIYIEHAMKSSIRNVRKIAPHIPILANIGAVQLNYGFTREHCIEAVSLIEADALILHLNPLQEVLQSGGNTNFSGLLGKIEKLCKGFPVPIIVKEVGWGISVQNAKRLTDAGVSFIDVAGAGGTSWAKVESYSNGRETQSIAEPFFSWGIPTAECIQSIHTAFPEIKLIASGGIQDGVEMAKAIFLGASLCGIAKPLLRLAVEQSSKEIIAFLQNWIQQYRIAIFISSGIEKINE